MKRLIKIILIISILLNLFLTYKVTLMDMEINDLKGFLSSCQQRDEFSLEVFQNTLIGKSKDEVIQIIPNIDLKRFVSTQDKETLRIEIFKFEFKKDTLQYISIDPR